MQSHIKFKNNFISNIKHWKHTANSTHLAICDFNIENYEPELFVELAIYFPDEIKKAVNKRQAEFLAGRFAAKQALLTIGFQQDTVPTIHFNRHRSPIWPKDFVGSITHNSSKVMCAISNKTEVRCLGVDVETILTNQSALEIAPQVHSRAEFKLLTSKGLSSNIATTLIFSAKESLFKAIYPSVKEYFGFECAEVISFNSVELTLALTKKFPFPIPHSRIYHCQFDIQEDIVITILVD